MAGQTTTAIIIYIERIRFDANGNTRTYILVYLHIGCVYSRVTSVALPVVTTPTGTVPNIHFRNTIPKVIDEDDNKGEPLHFVLLQ